MESDDVLFSLTVHRDGRVFYGGTPKGPITEALPAVLRTVAEAIESGGLVLLPAPLAN